MTEVERKKMMRERQKNSVLWQWIHRLGSLKSAVVLILTIALACAVATVYESNFNTAVAQYYIYKNPLFMLWLALLCMNLICSALTRWPWQKKHTGFVVTHSGIILLLAGAVVGRAIGWEASVTLEKGAEPTGILLRNETLLLFQGQHSGEVYTTPLEVKVRQPTDKNPRILPVPESNLKLKVDGYSENLSVVSRVIEDGQSGTAPGVSLVLHSNMMGQSLPVSLMSAPRELASYNMFGLAQINLLDKLPHHVASSQTALRTYRETHMVFEKSPEEPVIHNTNSQPSGYRFFLERDSGNSTLMLRAVSPDKKERVFPLAQINEKSFPGEEETTVIQVVSFWNDLKMVQGKPTEASQEMNNPAALITLTGHVAMEKKSPVLLLARQDKESVFYRVMRGDALIKQGLLKKGESFPLGWADWVATLEGSYDKARMVSQTEEAVGRRLPDQQTVPGLRLTLVTPEGKKGSTVWLASGTSRLLQVGEDLVRVGFGLKTERIPFQVSLENFQVPRDPGTDTPANFISSVRFHDAKTGEKIPGHIEMNHPASYPNEWWRGWIGNTYKFSQAGWDPDNINQTTLQVLHDPGWLMKWTGSLLICVGIFTMFYWKGSRERPSAT
jgi:hypothetical protein